MSALQIGRTVAERLTRGRGWTPADQAEQDLLLHALVTAWFEHRDRCDLDPDPHLIAAIDVVVDWREARLLLSNAEWLRAELEGAGPCP
jgi:hypothetical protein